MSLYTRTRKGTKDFAGSAEIGWIWQKDKKERRIWLERWVGFGKGTGGSEGFGWNGGLDLEKGQTGTKDLVGRVKKSP